MSNTPHPGPCPITELIAHSEQHFAPEPFDALCRRRVSNLEFVSERLLVNLAKQAPTSDAHNRIAQAAYYVRMATHNLKLLGGGDHHGVQLSQEEKAQGS